MPSPETPAITGVHTVGIPVTDQARAVAFYVETLGFEVRLDQPLDEESRWIEVAPPGAPYRWPSSGLRRAPSRCRDGRAVGGRRRRATHAALRARSVDADDLLRWPGVPPMFAFRDQDGNGLEIVEG